MSTLTLRSLNEAGIEEFRSYLQRLTAGELAAPPLDLLSSLAHSDELPHKIVIDLSRRFASKMEFGRYLEDLLEPLWSTADINEDRGLWTALGLAFFDMLCVEKNGVRKPGAEESYILRNEWKRRNRHLVRFPFVAVRIHGDLAYVGLSGAPDTHGENAEQLSSRLQILLNSELWKAATRLYVRKNGKMKNGASGKDAPGTFRRLGKVLKQYDLTYDLSGMQENEIYNLLPKEFDRFKSA